jgi:hypothetical protein
VRQNVRRFIQRVFIEMMCGFNRDSFYSILVNFLNTELPTSTCFVTFSSKSKRFTNKSHKVRRNRPAYDGVRWRVFHHYEMCFLKIAFLLGFVIINKSRHWGHFVFWSTENPSPTTRFEKGSTLWHKLLNYCNCKR